MDKKAQLTIIGAAIILLSVVTITYGFFVSGVDNSNPQTATITTGTMELTFADNDTGVAKQMIFGESIEKKFTLENTGTVDATAYLYWKDLVNTYLYGSLVYRLEYSTTANGTKTVVMNNAYVPRSETPTEKILSQILTVPADTTYYYTLTITLVNSETVDQTADLSATFMTGFNIKVEGSSESTATLAALNLTNQVQEEPTDYNMFNYTYNGYYRDISTGETVKAENISTAEGIYAMEDDFGTSYYFRGSKSLNNIVKFGKYDEDMYYYEHFINEYGDTDYTLGNTEECYNNASDTSYCADEYRIAKAGDDMLWRIVRINGDGTLRLFYIGTNENNTIGQANFNIGEDLTYTEQGTGYTYSNGEPNKSDGKNSSIKAYIDTWYSKTMTKEDNMVALAQFYNDSTTSTQNSAFEKFMSKMESHDGLDGLMFSAVNRLEKNSVGVTDNISPTLKTTTTDKIYGGIYYLKAGLITADELVLSGIDGIFGASNYGDTYLCNSKDYWTMTPAYYLNACDPYEFILKSSGQIHLKALFWDSLAYVLPVINLTPEAAQSLIGTGSTGDPYRLAS